MTDLFYSKKPSQKGEGSTAFCMTDFFYSKKPSQKGHKPGCGRAIPVLVWPPLCLCGVLVVQAGHLKCAKQSISIEKCR